MNPYDFVPLDFDNPPERKLPVWHHVLARPASHPTRLYSGSLVVHIRAETPIFIGSSGPLVEDPDNPEKLIRYQVGQNPDEPGEHICDKAGNYIIPGTALKGLLRSVVETLCRGCLTGSRQYWDSRARKMIQSHEMPNDFFACDNNESLCVACRLFGMMQTGQSRAKIFLGKVNIGNAQASKQTLTFHDPIYTAVLATPNPDHSAFYYDGDTIAGRKFYFHHHGRILTEKALIPVSSQGKDSDKRKYRNLYIKPLDTGTEFEARIDFTNLEADELAALLFAITLLSDMRHKIGYGKPIGLGSIKMSATKLSLVDYSKRYTSIHANRGISRYAGDELSRLLERQMASFDTGVHAAWKQFDSLPSLPHLQRIWQWPPDNTVVYCYPSLEWFDKNPTAPISATRNLPCSD
jgi:CRISPR/Cas system CSM-associated protein Csm3 (group 7 of RAMP superfamily)